MLYAQALLSSGLAYQKTHCNRRVDIIHQCRKTTVLSYHRCLINTGVEKMNNI